MTERDWRETMAGLEYATIRAVATEVFGGRADSIQRVRHGVSAIYRCETRDHGPCHLRFTHEALIPAERWDANAAFIEHLSAGGAPVSGLVRTHDGRRTVAVPVGSEHFLAMAVRGVPGRPLGRHDTRPRIFRAWGRAMGAMHRAAARYRPAERAAYLDEDDNWQNARDRLPGSETLAIREWERIDRWWRALPRDLESHGLTHADMNATNAIWDGDRVGLIDFDEPVWHVFAADLARPFREMDHHPEAARSAARAALLAGYREQRALAPEWEATLPWLVRMKQLEMFASALQQPGWQGSVLGDGKRREDFVAEQRLAFERYASAE